MRMHASVDAQLTMNSHEEDSVGYSCCRCFHQL